MKTQEKVKIIRIDIFDDETNTIISSTRTSQALFSINDTLEEDQTNIRLNLVGKPDQLVTLLNYQIQAMVMNLALKAVVTSNVAAPYFVLPSGSNN